MKRFLIFFGSLLVTVALMLALLPAATAQALPEYSAQTGEPCASCHISPSGGGARGRLGWPPANPAPCQIRSRRSNCWASN